MADKTQTVWIIVKEIGEYSAYFALIHSVWDTKDAAETCLKELREAEEANRPKWVTQSTGISIIEVPLNTPGSYWTDG